MSSTLMEWKVVSYKAAGTIVNPSLMETTETSALKAQALKLPGSFQSGGEHEK